MVVEKSHLAVAAMAAFLAAAGVAVVTRMPPALGTRTSPHTWPELTQQQVDKLTTTLKRMPPRDVAIFCWKGCDDLALSFDNAFESAKWRSGIETPQLDDTVGWSVGPASDPDANALRHAIFEVTGIEPKLTDARLLENRLALVLGRK